MSASLLMTPCFTLNGSNGIVTEFNSDMAIEAMRPLPGGGIELLSPGNKYLPVTQKFTCGKITAELEAVRGSSMYFIFSYDEFRREGKYVHFLPEDQGKKLKLEYGTVRANFYTPEQSQVFENAGGTKLRITLELLPEKAVFSVGSAKAEFATGKREPGMSAFARGPFINTLKVHSLSIEAENAVRPVSVCEFDVFLPEKITLEPVRCHVVLSEFDGYSEAALEFSGGVAATEPGEGNYHGMRADFFDNLYFKVLSPGGIQKTVLAPGRHINIPRNLAPDYFYGILYEKLDWPFRKTVRFRRPAGDVLFAVGADSYEYHPAQVFAQSPSETLFDSAGKTVYAGWGLTEKYASVTFRSQPEKEIAKHLPAPDPDALEFTRNNHYFFEGEPIHFRVEMKSRSALPNHYELHLLDAFLEPLETLKPEVSFETESAGFLKFRKTVCSVNLSGKKPGVYHLAVRSADPGFPELSESCAFEVMSRKKDALPPPLISGLPFLYNSRTETRGLLTDGFDPFFGESSDEGHYISCSNFLPPRARAKHIAPFVHAYGREWFLWLGSRCMNKWDVDSNRDLVAEADYVNTTDEENSFSVLWMWAYEGTMRKDAQEFMHGTRDPRLSGEFSTEAFRVIAKNYWPEFLDFMNERRGKRHEAMLAKLRGINPHARFSGYGPAHIYAGHSKGPEFIRYLGKACFRTEGHGFWQYEDYPDTCRYGLERGSWFLTCCLWALPGERICPELYTKGFQGCPDGAVYFAHPPFGLRTVFPEDTIGSMFLEYAGSSAYRSGGKFHYWKDYGFQACGFVRKDYEQILKTAGLLKKHAPVRPLRKGTAFVWSEDSWKNNQKTYLREYGVDGTASGQGIVDVAKPAAECVPFAYEMFRKAGLCGGFLCPDTELANLTADDVSALVLPPLKGMKPEVLAKIRELHDSGVKLLCFMDVSGMEDVFGVRDAGKETSVRVLRSENRSEFCREPQCSGHCAALEGTQVVIDAEIPVLTLRDNAAFFNVPPTLIRRDELHDRMGYGLDSISEMANSSTQTVLKKFSESPVSVNAGGRLAAWQTGRGETAVVVRNPDREKPFAAEVRIALPGKAACNLPFSAETSDGVTTVNLTLAPAQSALLTLK